MRFVIYFVLVFLQFIFGVLFNLDFLHLQHNHYYCKNTLTKMLNQAVFKCMFYIFYYTVNCFRFLLVTLNYSVDKEHHY